MEEHTAWFHFDTGLRGFLGASRRALEEFSISFKETPAVKHLVESLGVPHTEIGALRGNGRPIGLGCPVQPGDRVEVESVPDGQGSYGGDSPRFIADLHLGRLAAYLRMLGLDTLYRNDYSDEELARVSAEEGRVLLTRDRRLLMRSQVNYGCCLRSVMPVEQLHELNRRYRLSERAQPFQRCLRCNHPLQPVSKEAVLERLQPLTRRYYHEFALCPGCNQVYWRGSHTGSMERLIKEGLR